MASRHLRQKARPSLWARLRGFMEKTGGTDRNEEKGPPLLGSGYQAYLQTPGQPVWSPREYGKFADEGYMRNVVAHQAVKKIADGVASVPWQIFERRDVNRREVTEHPLLHLLKRPNPMTGGAEFFEALCSYRLVAGNSYVLRVGPKEGMPQELHLLRPDRVQVIAGDRGTPLGYRYTVGQEYRDYRVDRVTGQSEILHLKAFHPLNDWYGLSPIEAAAYSIDQHNQAGAWNQALLQNGARPSGALVVKGGPEAMNGGTLSEDQYRRIKTQIDDQYSGAANAGRPLLLEGGLDWREMSISPRDMDFIDAKHSSARDISLAFGVPPQLLGIPGDNTYANLAEARLALWEQTILPLMDHLKAALNNWLVPLYGDRLELDYNTDAISALAPRREAVWRRVKDAGFLSDEEKRKMVGM